jgi:hypothetical protein
MKEMALQLKTRVRNVNIMNNNIEVQKIILNIMISILAGLTLWYVLTLGNMIFDIVQRKALEKEMLVLSNEVSNLELSYLALSNSVDMTLSSSMGFKETKATFATRKSLGSLKLANNEI